MLKKQLALATLLGSSISANAAVITFNNISLNTDDPVKVSGYIFDYSNHNGWAIGNTTNTTNELGNGSNFITCRDILDSDCSITMIKSDGTSFSLLSFYGADGLLNVGGRSIEVIGILTEGGSITTTFTTVANKFSFYSLSPDFVNLKSVTFRGYGPGDDMIAFDNISVSDVPVPSAIWLFSTALIGLTEIKRKRNLQNLPAK